MTPVWRLTPAIIASRDSPTIRSSVIPILVYAPNRWILPFALKVPILITFKDLGLIFPNSESCSTISSRTAPTCPYPSVV